MLWLRVDEVCGCILYVLRNVLCCIFVLKGPSPRRALQILAGIRQDLGRPSQLRRSLRRILVFFWGGGAVGKAHLASQGMRRCLRFLAGIRQECEGAFGSWRASARNRRHFRSLDSAGLQKARLASQGMRRSGGAPRVNIAEASSPRKVPKRFNSRPFCDTG